MSRCRTQLTRTNSLMTFNFPRKEEEEEEDRR